MPIFENRLKVELGAQEVDLYFRSNYDVIMKAQIIQIGNSQGIRIPKLLLEETHLAGEVEMEVFQGGILIRNVQKPRGDWDAIFKSMADSDDDIAPAAKARTEFEKKEWQW